MKFFHKKFLVQESEFKYSNENSSPRKGRMAYFFNQFMIWGAIFCIVFAIIKFMFFDLNIN